jgi:UPF0755 protein
MKTAFSCLIVILIIIVAGWIILNLQFERPNDNPFGNKVFIIEEGQGVEAIAEELKAEGFLENPFYFKVYVALKNLRAKFKVGEYQLDTSMSIKELVKELTKDEPIRQEVKVTVLEGWNNQEIAEYLESLELFTQDEFLDYIQDNQEFDYEFLQARPKNASLEGYLYPDTYLVYEDAEPMDLVAKMLKNFDNKLTDQMRQDIEDQGKDLFDILTLASIVEKEMFGFENRQIVADIFWQRIEDNYPLQSDATVNYITKKGTTRPSIKDTEIDNPYNTYRYKGLPPGPICNPSIEAIKAVIYPQDTDYYFFLTTPDNEIIFSKTHEEHILNRQKYFD